MWVRRLCLMPSSSPILSLIVSRGISPWSTEGQTIENALAASKYVPSVPETMRLPPKARPRDAG